MKKLRAFAALPFLALALAAWVLEILPNAFGVLCMRTVDHIAGDPAIHNLLERLFLMRAVRCPRCGRSDVTTIVDD